MKNYKNKTIVAIGAHHDDIELFCGGTLVKYIKDGWDAVYIVATTSPHYHLTEEKEFLSNEDTINMRKKEAEQGAKIIGANEVHFWDFKSMYWYKENTHKRLFLDGIRSSTETFSHLKENVPGREFILTASDIPDIVQYVADFLEERNPDIILTHSPDDESIEHYATGLLVFRATMSLLKKGKNIKLFGWEPGGGGPLVNSFAPTHYVDVTETIDVKCKAVKVFHSQIVDHDTSKFVDWCYSRAQIYGNLIGVKYAEPFISFNNTKHMFKGWEKVCVPATYDVSKATMEFM
jgi:LmbE family N-acetylglucosaminyl deacetylase